MYIVTVADSYFTDVLHNQLMLGGIKSLTCSVAYLHELSSVFCLCDVAAGRLKSDILPLAGIHVRCILY